VGSQTEATSPTSNTGVIIGGALGGLALICITVFAVVFILRRGAKKRSGSSDISAENDNLPNREVNKDNAATQLTYGMNDIKQYPAELYAEREAVELPLYSLPRRAFAEPPGRDARFELG
jgi:hypothetical protein